MFFQHIVHRHVEHQRPITCPMVALEGPNLGPGAEAAAAVAPEASIVVADVGLLPPLLPGLAAAAPDCTLIRAAADCPLLGAAGGDVDRAVAGAAHTCGLYAPDAASSKRACLLAVEGRLAGLLEGFNRVVCAANHTGGASMFLPSLKET